MMSVRFHTLLLLFLLLLPAACRTTPQVPKDIGSDEQAFTRAMDLYRKLEQALRGGWVASCHGIYRGGLGIHAALAAFGAGCVWVASVGSASVSARARIAATFCTSATPRSIGEPRLGMGIGDVRGLVGAPDGSRVFTDESRGPAGEAVALGDGLAARLLQTGAGPLLAALRAAAGH